MRIISGSARGRKIKVPKTSLRPLSDQAREALFNILAAKVPDCDFLDLFAGTGSVGLEALSRGARLSIFVEIHRKSVDVIRENLSDLGFSDRSEVFALDVLRGIKIFAQKEAKFDIIFLGAPYGSPDLKKALELIGSHKLLKPKGVLIAEHRFKSVLDDICGNLAKFREERYGDTIFTFYSSIAS